MKPNLFEIVKALQIGVITDEEYQSLLNEHINDTKDTFTVKFKKIFTSAKVPTYATLGSACFDFYSIDNGSIRGSGSHSCHVFRTGIAVEVPEGWVLKVYSRSSHAFKNNTRLANCVGIIDSDYRGEIIVKLQGEYTSHLDIACGDRIAQGMLVPVTRVNFVEVVDLSTTLRGDGGIGSTGR